MSPAQLFQAIRKRSLRELIVYALILIRNAMGIENRLVTADRVLLEQTILPYYAERSDIHRVLFVGTDWFTRRYESLFPDKEYWTIDANPWKQQFAGSRHIVDSLQNLGRHFPTGHFQLIVCNGVFGWGLDGPEDCEQAFAQCFDCLSPGGLLLLGWNDQPPHCPFPVEQIGSIQRFHTVVFPPLGVARYLANQVNGHTYDFYQK